MVLVRSRSPVRISFAGGGTDVSPYPEERGGCVLSATINQYSYTSLKAHGKNHIKLNSNESQGLILQSIEDIVLDGNFDLAKTVLLEMRPKSGMELFFRNDVPPRSGLGSSAAGFVSLLGAYAEAFGKKFSRHEIANLAFDLERNKLKVKGGKQDQFASAYGGVNFIEFKKGEVNVSPLNLSAPTLNELEKNMVLVFTSKRQNNGSDIISDQTKSYVGGEKGVSGALDAAKQITLEMKSALEKCDLEEFGGLLHKGWEEKKKYSQLISTPFIDKLYDAALVAGAIGGKITGAGGGGYMLFYCYPDKEIAVKEKLESLGARNVPFSLEFKGLETWRLNDG
ncbi:MAG TPA: GHMP kinase [archaeon]|nr:GHMP kinase [archaeon]